MTYLLTPEEIHNARYDQIAACMNAKEIAEDWCRRQAKKIVTIMGPAIGLLIDDNPPCKDGSVPVFQRHLVLLAHYWAELENAVGVFRSSQVNAAGKGCPGKAPDGTCDATEAPCGPGSRTGCFAGATHKCYYCDHEGTDVNRIAEFKGDHIDEDSTDHCCDDARACSARTRG